MIPTVFGFPLWRNLKRRVAKKYLRRYRMEFVLDPAYWMLRAKIGVGDFVNDCTSFNGRILKLRPKYWRVGNGQVLGNVEFSTENTGCSWIGCGVEPKLSREEIERRVVEHHREWTLTSGGETWYGAGSEQLQAVRERAQKEVAIIEGGGHITTEDGELLPEISQARDEEFKRFNQ